MSSIERSFCHRFLSSMSAIKEQTIAELVHNDYDSVEALMALDVTKDLPQLKSISLGQRSLLRMALRVLREHAQRFLSSDDTSAVVPNVNFAFNAFIETVLTDISGTDLSKTDDTHDDRRQQQKKTRKRKKFLYGLKRTRQQRRSVLIDIDDTDDICTTADDTAVSPPKTSPETGPKSPEPAVRDGKCCSAVLSERELMRTVSLPLIVVTRCRVSDDAIRRHTCATERRHSTTPKAAVDRPYRCDVAGCSFTAIYPFSLAQHRAHHKKPALVLHALNNIVRSHVKRSQFSPGLQIRKKRRTGSDGQNVCPEPDISGKIAQKIQDLVRNGQKF